MCLLRAVILVYTAFAFDGTEKKLVCCRDWYRVCILSIIFFSWYSNLLRIVVQSISVHRMKHLKTMCKRSTDISLWYRSNDFYCLVQGNWVLDVVRGRWLKPLFVLVDYIFIIYFVLTVPSKSFPLYQTISKLLLI